MRHNRFLNLLCSALLCSPFLCSAQKKAVVSLGSIYLRAHADYESPLETQALMGEVVEILDSSGIWYRIRCNQPYEAWTGKGGVTLLSDELISRYAEAPKYIIVSLHSTALDSPENKARPMYSLICGDILRVPADGAKKRGSFTRVLLPDCRTAWVRSKDMKPLSEWEAGLRALTASGKIEKAIGWSISILGTPYLWGGMTPDGIDCSGLVRMSFLNAGIRLPRNVSQIISCGKAVAIGGNPAQGWDLSDLRRGDLLFFGERAPLRPEGMFPARPREMPAPRATHVGIYLGDGLFIHSSYCVRINSLKDIRNGGADGADQYENSHRLLCARRIVE